jgi:hypothetical protein
MFLLLCLSPKIPRCILNMLVHSYVCVIDKIEIDDKDYI